MRLFGRERERRREREAKKVTECKLGEAIADKVPVESANWPLEAQLNPSGNRGPLELAYA